MVHKALSSLLVAVVYAAVVCPSAIAGDFRVELDQEEALRIEADGDIIVPAGWVVPLARLHAWTSELRPRENVREFVVVGAGGNVVAMIDEARKNLYLRGTIATGVSTLAQNPNVGEFVVSSGGVDRAIIDSAGNLGIRGGITHGTCDTARQDLVNQYADLGYNFFDTQFGAVQCYKLVNNSMYVNPGSFNFDALSCNHGGLARNHGTWQWDETVSRMYQAVADQYGVAINVTSGFRGPTKNNSISGANNQSKHAYGRAFDYAHPSAGSPSTQANWLIAVAAETAGVNTARIRLYNQTGASQTYQWFLDNNYHSGNLPPGWTMIAHGHCDSGQPNQEPR